MADNWSINRDKVLHSCERKYFFHYILHARVNSRDPLLKEIAILKKMKNLYLWKGGLFHEMVEKYLTQEAFEKSSDYSSLITRYNEITKLQWMNSSKQQYDLKNLGKGDNILLMEHEYEMELPQTVEQVIQENEKNFLNFYQWANQNSLIKQINKAKKYWIEPDLFRKNTSSFFLNGNKIFAKVDLAILNLDDTFDIYDWKSGHSRKTSYWDMDSDELQMSVYQLWPHLQFDRAFDDIRAHLVYFGENPINHNLFSMDENKKELIVNLIKNSMKRVEKFEKLLENEKKPIKHFDFASSTRICYNCVYKRICRRDIES